MGLFDRLVGKFLSVRVKPGARESAVLGMRDDKAYIAVAAPAHDGKANAELLRFLSRSTGAVWTIVSGHRGRDKLLQRKVIKR